MVDPNPVSPASREELEPCPFCGGAARFRANEIDFEPVWGVACDDECGAWIDVCADTKEEAAEVWNTRAPDPALKASEARERELREALDAAAVLLVRCERRLEVQEGLNRSGLRMHLTEFLDRRAKALAASLPLDGEGKE